jgi:DNA/RNA-binding domain of Phe-tRNA-synthetase-like protein
MRWIIRNRASDRVFPAWFGLRGVTVRPASEALHQEIQLRCGELQARYRDPASALPAFTPARRMYHACGMDPSKTRPSSEALVRRVLQGKGLYQVNTAVDAANLASITIFRSIGLYDADRIHPEAPSEAGNSSGHASGVIQLRLGRAGEQYPGIGKESIHLEGRPALVDAQGPFGNPSADSERTKVTPETRRLLFVLFEPVGDSQAEVEKRLSICSQILMRHVGGELEE